MQNEVHWSPIENIPRSGIGDFSLESDRHTRLKITAYFASHDLRIEFDDVLAFRTLWDGDQSLVGSYKKLPTLIDGTQGGLVKVENSEWLYSGDFLHR